jgi:23S rRNA (guanine2445-N2)-methyltransferase / 23S rRNA (guanine2069-N7)-methyltransferase
MPLDLIATTASGLEAVTRRELEGLGYRCRVISTGWIHFEGDWLAICRANLWLRTADRIVVRMASFPAEDFDTLFETVRELPWEAWLSADAAFPVAGRSVQSQLSSVPACQRAVKKAIVERLRHAHRVVELPETGAERKVEVAIVRNQATLTIDTTGPSLQRRGYHQVATGGSLRPTLAAALVMLSFWDRERPLLDPFCRSGTIPIEAALLGRQIAPGLSRGFAAEAWPEFPRQLWEETRSEARDRMLPPFDQRMVGTDMDPRAVAAAWEAADRAGVSDQVHFQPRSFDQLTSKRTFGCVVTHPPCAQRAQDWHALEPLYQSIPVVLRRLPTWSHFILTAYPRFEALLGRSAERRRKLYRGPLECTYYQFHGPRPSRELQASATPHCDLTPEGAEQVEPRAAHSPRGELMPVFGGLTAKGRQQAELFQQRLIKLARHLRRWPTKQGITCYRLYDRDIPEIPLVVDRFEDHLHITEYERPHDRDAAQHADWLDLMSATAGKALEIPPQHVFLKRRQRQRGSTQYQHLAERKYELTVREGGLRFIVNLSDYVDTGLFLDHRITRSMVRDLAQGAEVLNLFGYTGTFSVYAAAGGAKRTTTVDWSNTYLDWARRNLELNGLLDAPHCWVREDAREYLRRLPAATQFDLAIVDPPTYSNSKRTEDDWDVQQGHGELLACLLRHMRPEGIVIFSTNFRRFRLDTSTWPPVRIHEISRQTVPPDFRNQRIHRCWKIVVTPPAADPVRDRPGGE